jgi:hypothetical protein
MIITLGRVLRYMTDVQPKSIPKVQDQDLIWSDLSKMQTALDGITWFPDSRVPTGQEVIDARPLYEAWLPGEQARTKKVEIGDTIRQSLPLLAAAALQARAENKTVDEIIAETEAKV